MVYLETKLTPTVKKLMQKWLVWRRQGTYCRS
jgi:hypothetical protein